MQSNKTDYIRVYIPIGIYHTSSGWWYSDEVVTEGPFTLEEVMDRHPKFFCAEPEPMNVGEFFL